MPHTRFTPTGYDDRWFTPVTVREMPNRTLDHASCTAWFASFNSGTQEVLNASLVVNEIHDLTKNEQDILLQQALRLFTSTMSNELRAKIIRGLRSVNADERNEFINLILSLLPPTMQPHDVMFITCKIANAELSKNELKIFCSDIFKLLSLDMTGNDRGYLISNLLSKSTDERRAIMKKHFSEMLDTGTGNIPKICIQEEKMAMHGEKSKIAASVFGLR